MDNWDFPASENRRHAVQIMTWNPARTQSGMSLLETMGALAIAAVLVMGLTSMVDASMDDLKGQQAALHQSLVTRAAERYIRSHYEDLINATTGGRVEPVTMAELKAARFLSNGFSDTNNYRQTPCVLVRQPSPGRLDALVVTYGGEKIPERYIRMVALQAGQGGGYISETEPAVARGASWSLNTADYQDIACNGSTVLNGSEENDGGHLVSSLFHDGADTGGTDFLYRNEVANRPELNRMNTAIRMGGAAQRDANTDCTVEGAVVPGVAVDSTTNQLLYCSTAGVWAPAGSSHWKDPVDNFDALLEESSSSSPGDVRLTLDQYRAFAFNGSGWVALAVDQHGDMVVPRDVRSRDMIASGRIHSDGTIYAAGHIETMQDAIVRQDLRVTRDASIGRDLTVSRDAQIGQDLRVTRNTRIGQDAEVVRNVIADGVSAETWMYASAVHLGSAMSPGGVCNYPNGSGQIAYPVGTAVTDANGLLMSCYRVPGTETYYFDYPRNFGQR